MRCSLNRFTACIYLFAIAATSMPISVGLLGWCPCGCIPDALGPTDAGRESEPSEHGDSHHHDSHHCRGSFTLPYCPIVTEVALTGVTSDAARISTDANLILPSILAAPPMRPPRA